MDENFRLLFVNKIIAHITDWNDGVKCHQPEEYFDEIRDVFRTELCHEDYAEIFRGTGLTPIQMLARLEDNKRNNVVIDIEALRIAAYKPIPEENDEDNYDE